MRLITCSNSAPHFDPATGRLRLGPGSPGGLIPIMVALLDELSGDWVFTAPSGTPSEPDANGPVGLHPLVLDDRLADAHYGAVSIRTLLWLFHYAFDTTHEPSFGPEFRAAWEGYRAVNERFAAAMVRLRHNDPDEVVLVHDFHLMLVPGLLGAAPARRGRLVYFHHVPWCGPDYFGVLPEWMRTAILTSLLAGDVVGFHSRRWAEAFLACCERFLPAAKVDTDRVEHEGHIARVAVSPGPIDASALGELVDSPGTAGWRERLATEAGGRRAIVRVDRLDLWKNVVRGFEAFELLLSRAPALADELWFGAVVTTPRRPTERSAQYQARCEAAAARINDRFGGRLAPVSLIYPEGGGNTRHRAVAALQSAAAVLVNPTFDGLNMVAKEAAVVAPDTPLLLSVNAGAYDQLRTGVTAIHPFDVEMTADALDAALDGAPPPGARQCHASLLRESAATWLAGLLAPPGR